MESEAQGGEEATEDMDEMITEYGDIIDSLPPDTPDYRFDYGSWDGEFAIVIHAPIPNDVDNYGAYTDRKN